MKKWFLSMCILFLMFGFAGCSQGEEKADNPDNGETNDDSNDGSTDNEEGEPAEDNGDDNGEGSEDGEEEPAEPVTEDPDDPSDGPSGQDLPKGLPEDFPVPNDAVISATSTISDETYNYMTFAFETSTEAAELLDLYKEYMEDNGFENVYEITSNDGSMMGGELEGSSLLVSFGPTPEGGNEVSIIYNQEK